MRHAALVVTPGGHGTLIKALSAGLPVVVLHHGRGPGDMARRGRRGTACGETATIAEAVGRVPGNPGYVRAGSLGETIRRDADSGMLLRELETVPDHVDIYHQTGLGRHHGPRAVGGWDLRLTSVGGPSLGPCTLF